MTITVLNHYMPVIRIATYPTETVTASEMMLLGTPTRMKCLTLR